MRCLDANRRPIRHATGAASLEGANEPLLTSNDESKLAIGRLDQSLDARHRNPAKRIIVRQTLKYKRAASSCLTQRKRAAAPQALTGARFSRREIVASWQLAPGERHDRGLRVQREQRRPRDG
jgi:hypothetical protein